MYLDHLPADWSDHSSLACRTYKLGGPSFQSSTRRAERIDIVECWVPTKALPIERRTVSIRVGYL